MAGGKHGRSPSTGSAQAGKGVPLDKLLVPRVESYAANNNYTDVEEVSAFLRKTYREYARTKTGPFKQMVAKAIRIVEARGGVQKPELQLQVTPGVDASLALSHAGSKIFCMA